MLLAASIDELAGPAREEEMLVGVQVSDIARMKPSVAKCGPREFFVAEVSFHYRGSTHHHLSRLTGGHATAVAIHNGHFVTGRATARTIPSLFRKAVHSYGRTFRQSVNSQ